MNIEQKKKERAGLRPSGNKQNDFQVRFQLNPKREEMINVLQSIFPEAEVQKALETISQECERLLAIQKALKELAVFNDLLIHTADHYFSMCDLLEAHKEELNGQQRAMFYSMAGIEKGTPFRSLVHIERLEKILKQENQHEKGFTGEEALALASDYASSNKNWIEETRAKLTRNLEWAMGLKNFLLLLLRVYKGARYLKEAGQPTSP